MIMQLQIIAVIKDWWSICRPSPAVTCRHRPSSAIIGRRILGLTRSVASRNVKSSFFDDLWDIFDRVVGYNEQVYIVGDLNVIRNKWYAACFKTSVSSSRCRRLMLKSLLLISSGVQMMFSWVVIVSPCTCDTIDTQQFHDLLEAKVDNVLFYWWCSASIVHSVSDRSPVYMFWANHHGPSGYSGQSATCQADLASACSCQLFFFFFSKHHDVYVPQGSVLGTLLFLLYCGDLQLIIESHGLCLHLYADDPQICGSCRPSAIPELQTCISACIDEVTRWMRSNRLQLNSSKTVILWLATSRRLHQLPRTPLPVGADFVVPSAVGRDFGISYWFWRLDARHTDGVNLFFRSAP